MIATRKLLTDQEARDVIEIAIGDGASLYWIARVVSRFGPDGRAGKPERLIIEASRDDGASPPERFRITLDRINDAATALILNRSANAEIMADVAKREFDQTSADCVLQLATFGEIIYG